MLSPVTKKLITQLKKADLSLEDRTALTTALLKKLNALPLHSTIILTQQGIMLNGKMLDTEQTINFKESCRQLQDNFAYKVIHEQTRYLAIKLGINIAVSLDTLMFAKAAIWILEQKDELLEKISTV